VGFIQRASRPTSAFRHLDGKKGCGGKPEVVVGLEMLETIRPNQPVISVDQSTTFLIDANIRQTKPPPDWKPIERLQFLAWA